MSTASAFLGQHFAYASGKTAVLKQHLLSESDLHRLLGTHSLTEFERAVAELKLMEPVRTSANSVESLLVDIEQLMKQEIERMSPKAKQQVFGILWLSGDAPRLSFLLKKYHGLSSQVSSEPITSLSFWNPEALREHIAKEVSSSLLPESLQTFIASIKALSSPVPWAIDRATAAFIAERKIALARASGSKEILRYVMHSIDIANIRTALRLSEGSTNHEEPEAALLPGGSIFVHRLIGSRASIRTAIATSDLYAPFIPAKGRADAIDVEQIGAAILAEDIGRMWTVPLTVEPVFAFAAMVMAHVRLLRAIAIGKRNHLSPQEIKQILPPFISSSQFPA